jgi:nucleoredoxin
MLRTGYTSEAVQNELATRHFIGSLDIDAEKSLRKAGASPSLVEALKNGSYQLPLEQARSAEREIAAQARRHEIEADESRRSDAAYQDKLLRARAAFKGRSDTQSATIAELVKNDLVSLRNGNLSHFDDDAIAKKALIAVFFSARWCGPCHKFTPKLIQFYNRLQPQHSEFEVILISHDRSPTEMETHMREMQMPWPAVEFDKLKKKEGLKKYAGNGIPCLVLLDASGKVISDSYSGKTYVGPEKVLDDLEAILTHGSVTTASR